MVLYAVSSSSVFKTWGIWVRLSSLYVNSKAYTVLRNILMAVNAFAPTICWNMGGY